MSEQRPPQPTLEAMYMLGTWLEQDAEAKRRYMAAKPKYSATLEKLNPIELQAITQAVAEEWRRRFGEDDDSVNYEQAWAMRNWVRDHPEGGK